MRLPTGSHPKESCQKTCSDDPNCKYVVHWHDGGCQRFSSATGSTQGTANGWTANAKIYECAQPNLCGSPPHGKMFKVAAWPAQQLVATSTVPSGGCFEDGKVCVGDRTVMEAKAEGCNWITGNLYAHTYGKPDPDTVVELPALKRIGDISPTLHGGLGDLNVLYSSGNSGKLEEPRLPNLVRVEGLFRVEGDGYERPDFKIKVVEAPKLTYANRLTVYATHWLETHAVGAEIYSFRVGDLPERQARHDGCEQGGGGRGDLARLPPDLRQRDAPLPRWLPLDSGQLCGRKEADARHQRVHNCARLWGYGRLLLVVVSPDEGLPRRHRRWFRRF